MLKFRLSIFLPLMGMFILIGAGCTTKSKARQNAQMAYLEGQRDTLANQQALQNSHLPQVYFRGQFRHQSLPWQEGLTLAEALISAEFLGQWDPHEILLTRNQRTTRIRTTRLLNGRDNPLLEPDDQIEIIR